MKFKSKKIGPVLKYYLNHKLHRGWHSIAELAALEECEISQEAVRSRIKSEKFKTLWEAVSTPQLREGSKRSTYISKKEKRKLRPPNEHEIFMATWKPGTYWREANNR